MVIGLLNSDWSRDTNDKKSTLGYILLFKDIAFPGVLKNKI